MKHSGWLAVSKKNRATVFLSGIQTREQAEALIERVYGLDAYRAEWADAWDDAGEADPICDFCSGKPVIRRMKMPNIMSDSVWVKNNKPEFRMLHEMLGDWLVCRTCWDLVVVGRWGDLSERSAQGYVDAQDIPEDRRKALYHAVLGQVLPLHHEVRRLWLGQSEPVHKEGGES